MKGSSGLALAIVILSLYACNEQESKMPDVVDVSLPNYNFRYDVLLQMKLSKDTLAIFDTILNKLDAKGVSFPKYISQSFYDLSDSITIVANKKFAKESLTMDIQQQDFYQDYHYKELSKAIGNYESSMGIDEKLSKTIEYIIVSYDEIKLYCAKWRALNKN